MPLVQRRLAALQKGLFAPLAQQGCPAPPQAMPPGLHEPFMHMPSAPQALPLAAQIRPCAPGMQQPLFLQVLAAQQGSFGPPHAPGGTTPPMPPTPPPPGVEPPLPAAPSLLPPVVGGMVGPPPQPAAINETVKTTAATSWK
jgi:hypothetical protein